MINYESFYRPDMSLIDFLDTTGVLIVGDVSEVNRAKEVYRKLYAANYKRRYRQEALTVQFSLRGAPANKLKRKADKEKLTPGTLAKRETLGYLNGRSASFDPHLFSEVIVLVLHIHTKIKRLAEDLEMEETERYEKLLDEVAELKQALVAYRKQKG